MILVLIYILTIFLGKDWFSITELGIFFTLLGSVWLLFSLKKFSWKTSFQPIILILIGFISIQQNSILVLKSFPLTLSTLFFLAFIYAEVTKEYFLIKYIGKFKKLDNTERIYLEKTHLIWIVVTAINVSLHSYFLFFGSIEEWTFYSTVGWYILLGCGILFQIAFRRFYEKNSD
ncbi:hypothetical protein GSY74_09590 [Sulfurovum sp. bin170]|uniref:hypothetical protein n=1 Tax=Sulfurovum sp. bin170 TaxID=2695268 RepID=UPI0013DEFD48|nr:hypothetical protein [Sulfurovum sp. bin170]NEW61534.1 hypothetical protein [Sulfurovum sp. bin170]